MQDLTNPENILKEIKDLTKGKYGFFDLFAPGKYKTINKLLDTIQRYDAMILLTEDTVADIERLNLTKDDTNSLLKRFYVDIKRMQEIKKEKIKLVEIIANTKD